MLPTVRRFLDQAAARCPWRRRRIRLHQHERGGCSVYHDPDQGVIEVTKSPGRKVLIAARHMVFLPGICGSFDRYFDAVVPHTRGKYRIVDYSSPTTHRVNPIQLPFDCTGFAENLESLKLEYFHAYQPKPGDIVFDGGAYCGESAYLFSQAVGEAGRVYAFEPDPENYAALLRNIERHCLRNVVPVPKGLWSTTTTLEFFGEGNLGSSLVPMGYRDTGTAKTRIDVVSIPDAFREYDLPRLDVLKLDIEGAEVETISGAAEFLAGSQHPHIVVANHLRDGKNSCERVEALLRDAGYDVKTDNLTEPEPSWRGLMLWAEKRKGSGSAAEG